MSLVERHRRETRDVGPEDLIRLNVEKKENKTEQKQSRSEGITKRSREQISFFVRGNDLFLNVSSSCYGIALIIEYINHVIC